METKVKNLSRISSIPKEVTPCKAGFREYKIPGGQSLHWIQLIMSLSRCTPSIWQICWGPTFPASPLSRHQRETRRLQAQHWSAFWIPTFHLFDFGKISLDHLLSVKVALSLWPQSQHPSYAGETTFGKADVLKWDNKEMGKEQQIRTER